MATLDELVVSINAQGAKVKEVKTSGSKEEIASEVAKLVELKQQLTAIDPAHELALKDKKKKPKKDEPKKDEGPSKNEAKKAAKKAAKAEKKASHKETAAKEAPAKEAGTVYYSAERAPIVARAVSRLVGENRKFVQVDSKQMPVVSVASSEVFGDRAIARLVLREAGKFDFLGSTTVDQWVDFSLAYPSVGDVATLLTIVDQRLEQSTYLVGHRLTLADVAVWAVVKDEKSDLVNVKRWLKLCSATLDASFEPAQELPDEPDNCPPLEGAVEGEVVTRFPPEPSGYLHIGHAKAMLLNDYYAKRYKGTLLIRFDDTNPSKEKEEFEENIIKDMETLGVDTSKISHTSDYFKQIEKYARQLIVDGRAFMDDTPQDQMQQERTDRVNSKHRDDAPEACLAMFDAMLKGQAPDWCLRAKIDMSSDNGTMRDPVLYRTNLTPHHRTGTTFKAYPTYDLACPIVDSIEGVTHALRTTEYNDRDFQYYWLLDAMKLRKVRIHAFSRINFVRTLMSKRKLLWLVENKVADGWNDPRFPTVQGITRRGVSVQALRDFIVSQGASRNIIHLEWDAFWAVNKAAYEPTAHRYMGVEKSAVRLTITNFDDDMAFLSAPLVPKDPTLGSRPVRIYKHVLIEAEEVPKVVGEEIVLMRWGLVEITSLTPLEGEFVPGGIFKKKRPLHWLADAPGAAVDATFVEYDHLILKPKLEEDDKLTDPGVLTPVSKVETPALVDAALKHLDKGAVLQLERRGFYKVDVPYSPEGTLTLILIPDGKAKAPFSRLPSATS